MVMFVLLADKVLPSVLQKAQVSLLSQTECKKSYGLVSPRMLCAGVSSGERDACRVSSCLMVYRLGELWSPCSESAVLCVSG